MSTIPKSRVSVNQIGEISSRLMEKIRLAEAKLISANLGVYQKAGRIVCVAPIEGVMKPVEVNSSYLILLMQESDFIVKTYLSMKGQGWRLPVLPAEYSL